VEHNIIHVPKVAEFKVELSKLGEILLQEIESLKQAIFEKWEGRE